MTGTDAKPTILTWKGAKVYQCRLCAFNTFTKATFEDHFRKVHPPLQIIEGKADTSADLHDMTRDELKAHAAHIGVTDVPASATKADLIAAIEATQKEKD